jgi:hypothetical protein
MGAGEAVERHQANGGCSCPELGKDRHPRPPAGVLTRSWRRAVIT